MAFFAVLTLFHVLPSVSASEVISDLLTPEYDKGLALKLRAEHFWEAVGSVADEMRLTQHVQLYQDTEKVIAELDAEHSVVREALEESLQRLRNADGAVLAQGLESSEVATEELVTGPRGKERGGLSWFATGGPNFLAKAITLFVDGGDYNDRLGDHIKQRQQSLLPVLKSAASVTGNVLADCRLSSKRAFDVLKYDIYTKGAPKTPEAAKTVANALVKASADTRHRFMQFVTGMATSLAEDVKSRSVSAASTVALHELSALPAVESPAVEAKRPGLSPETSGIVMQAAPEKVQDVEERLPFLGL